ncbi:hypothetical protein [Planosporangium mesophilum]|uniref:Uncharacterized protein n=1 Tax=Planosporangium mesophilum TaxID=689768 RepID=A0A8J3TDZ8_9ACTN|nr:hypothetical protein [Planosporangium mesophilum]NJC82925.1 hypothetical protein [Planosporangium mesophilum]GII24703.1 hypothetical protein Pme01_43000 [Planosporangium mesophilum]
MDREAAGRGCLEHLTDADLRVLAATAGLDTERAGELRGRPATVLELFDRPELFDQVYGQQPAGLVAVSPFVAFLVAVEQATREIATTAFVAERSAPRQRVPVFDAPRLREFLADPMRRLFLAELLTSFVRVASGRYWTRTARGWRSKRYSELDPVGLADMAEQSPPAYRPGRYRRLGDVALFLTGVFPDYTQLYAFGPFDAARLLRAAGLPADDSSGLVTSPPIALLEQLGQRWYRRALDLAPVTTTQLAVVSEVADRFTDARRILNHIADQYFCRIGNPWFGEAGA